MCAWKAVDAVEDVYCSLYQQKGRLDVAGKLMTVRLVGSLVFFTALLLLTRSLLISLVASTLLSLVLFVLLNLVCRKICPTEIREKGNNTQVFHLLGGCFSLFLIGFLSYYITNAPKYSIDALLSEEIQAYYGFISMPVFVIGLLGNYLFNPLIQPMSEHWAKGETAWVTKKLIRQTVVVLGITVICLGGAYLLGIPVLSLLYGADLSGCRDELLVLLAGGGLLALSNQLMTVIVILRRQTFLIIGYGICAVLALVLSTPIVSRASMMGAAILELILMLCLCIIFAILFVVELHRVKKTNH
jgi:O-antigen/teichoic acid export membrane protein